MIDRDRLKNIVKKSNELSQLGENERALALIDQSLEDAARESRSDWIRVLSHHGAVLADSMGDVRRVRQYYERSLASNPGNPGALYGLAKVLLREGATEEANELPTKCYQSIRQSQSELDRALLDLLLDAWPQFAGPRQ
jgi:tetratricopeptide (TPR) repeat protein